MTCIVGSVTPEGKIVMGGDSAGISGTQLTIRKDEKVFIKGDFIFGFTSSYRMGQIIRYSFNPAKQPDTQDVDSYMNTWFINGLRGVFADLGYLRKDDQADVGGTFLVGYKSRLFQIDSDFQVGEAIDSFDACGCASDVALGAMYALQKLALSDEEKIKQALEAAEHFSAGVRAPFKILTL